MIRKPCAACKLCRVESTKWQLRKGSKSFMSSVRKVSVTHHLRQAATEFCVRSTYYKNNQTTTFWLPAMGTIVVRALETHSRHLLFLRTCKGDITIPILQLSKLVQQGVWSRRWSMPELRLGLRSPWLKVWMLNKSSHNLVSLFLASWKKAQQCRYTAKILLVWKVTSVFIPMWNSLANAGTWKINRN